MAAIEAHGITIEFPFYHLGARSLKKRILAGTRLHVDAADRVVISALRDLTFSIGKGERVALIGPNGAGKTTLLRTLAMVYTPAAGRLRIEGQVGSLIDVAAGLDPDSTGRENIRLRGLYRGLDDAACEALAEEVIGFAGLGEFIDLPIRTYSAGMSIRLAFAVATAMNPQVLLMDEWFLAGDEAFMRKAEARLTQLVNTSEILVLATHDLNVVRRWCTRAIRLENGAIVQDGPVSDLVPAPVS